jgi:hypothetical protein
MIPNVILTGNPGGTVIVIKSKNFITISYGATISWSLIIKMQYEAIAKQNRKIKNFDDWRWNSFYCSLGNEIILINWPFNVLKLVRITQTGMPYASLNNSNFDIFFFILTWIIVVPSYTYALLSNSYFYIEYFSKTSAFLTMGTD